MKIRNDTESRISVFTLNTFTQFTHLKRLNLHQAGYYLCWDFSRSFQCVFAVGDHMLEFFSFGDDEVNSSVSHLVGMKPGQFEK